jgi:hypothetical protein
MQWAPTAWEGARGIQRRRCVLIQLSLWNVLYEGLSEYEMSRLQDPLGFALVLSGISAKLRI